MEEFEHNDEGDAISVGTRLRRILAEGSLTLLPTGMIPKLPASGPRPRKRGGQDRRPPTLPAQARPGFVGVVVAPDGAPGRGLSRRVWLGQRYSDTRLGRWLSQDPLGFDGGWNLCTCVGQNPTNLVDPVGLQPPAWAVMLGAGLVNEAYYRLSGNYARLDGPENNRVTLPNVVSPWEGGTYQRVPVQVQMALSAPELGPHIDPMVESALARYKFAGHSGMAGKGRRPGNIFRMKLQSSCPRTLPSNAQVFNNAGAAFEHLAKNHGIDPVLSSERLDQIKPASGGGS